jgi:hypothetical protein
MASIGEVMNIGRACSWQALPLYPAVQRLFQYAAPEITSDPTANDRRRCRTRWELMDTLYQNNDNGLDFSHKRGG